MSVTEGVPSKRRRAEDRSPVENALRYIASQRNGPPLVQLLQNAIEWPTDGLGPPLRPLIRPTEVLTAWTAGEKAAALQQLIIEGVEHASVGPSEHSRERRSLRAALRLPDSDITDEWAGTLGERWEQLKVLKVLFPETTTRTTQPMEAAWTRGVRKLAGYIDRAFREEVEQLRDWQRLRNESIGEAVVEEPTIQRHVFREASEGAQPFFVDRFVTTVFMSGRALVRRITERVVTAQADEVQFYSARTYSGGRTFRREYVPVHALWGCRAEPMSPTHPSEPLATRLYFAHPLKRGEQAYFATEALFSVEPSGADERDWVEVDIDHHGITQGALEYGGTFPVSGLTIRIRFDRGCLPAAVWWYAEATESERLIQPPPNSNRSLAVIDAEVSHTFTELVCQPRENYGVGISWNKPEAS